MADCKLELLETSFSPGKIRMVIELVPLDRKEFDLPIEDAGKKLSSVANYARETFGVRSAPVGPPKPGQKSETRPPVRVDRSQRALSRVLKGGADRAIKVMEDELARAKEGKDPEAIKRAEAQLARAQEMKKKQGSST